MGKAALSSRMGRPATQLKPMNDFYFSHINVKAVSSRQKNIAAAASGISTATRRIAHSASSARIAFVVLSILIFN